VLLPSPLPPLGSWLGAFFGYGCVGFFFGRAGGIFKFKSGVALLLLFLLPDVDPSPPFRFLESSCDPAVASLALADPRAACSFCNLEKNFCACDRICTAVFVPMCSSIFLHALPYFFNDSTNNACSSAAYVVVFVVVAVAVAVAVVG
jgi:hypothetical protein